MADWWYRYLALYFERIIIVTISVLIRADELRITLPELGLNWPSRCLPKSIKRGVKVRIIIV